MKIRRDTLKQAKSLLRLSWKGGQIDQGKARELIQAIVKAQPRDALALLKALSLLLKLETDKRTVSIRSATPLPDEGAAIFSQMDGQHGAAWVKNYQLDPSLVGGLRVQRGSTIWDGSIAQRLETLSNYDSLKQ